MGGYGWWAEPIGELRGWPQTPNTRRDIPRISGDAQCSPFRSHQAGRGGAPATALVGVLPRGARRREIVRGGVCGVAGCGAAAVQWLGFLHPLPRSSSRSPCWVSSRPGCAGWPERHFSSSILMKAAWLFEALEQPPIFLWFI